MDQNNGNPEETNQWSPPSPPERTVPNNDPATNPWLNPPQAAEPETHTALGSVSDPTSRRRFLRTAVVAGGAVAAVSAMGGVVMARNHPRLANSILPGSVTPSGHCIEIVEGVKGSPQNPNQHIQVSYNDFITYIGTYDIGTNTFTIVHSHAILVDKNHHNPDLITTIISADFEQGNTAVVSLLVNPGVTTTNEYPAKSCLYVSQTLSATRP
ncbi:MAG: hypothetical protein OJF49_000821 [Ktedonobacterales bacterium]|jgi:hypothetical protein|nr:MAG: hypothetical protein OJF49_000821 [Ktedonobacterales bacterium]